MLVLVSGRRWLVRTQKVFGVSDSWRGALVIHSNSGAPGSVLLHVYVPMVSDLFHPSSCRGTTMKCTLHPRLPYLHLGSTDYVRDIGLARERDFSQRRAKKRHTTIGNPIAYCLGIFPIGAVLFFIYGCPFSNLRRARKRPGGNGSSHHEKRQGKEREGGSNLVSPGEDLPPRKCQLSDTEGVSCVLCFDSTGVVLQAARGRLGRWCLILFFLL